MRERSEGSLASLRRLNRRRVISALREHGTGVPRRDRAPHRPLALDRLQPRRELQSDGLVVEREEPGAAHGEQGGRPPILLVVRRRRPAPRSGSTSATATCAWRSPTCRRTILAERAAPIDVDHAAHEGARRRARADRARSLAEAGVDRSRVIGAGLGLPGPDRPRRRRHRLVGDPARLGRASPPARRSRRRLDVPVSVDNDANLGALAELATAPAAARPTSSTSRSRRASAPG